MWKLHLYLYIFHEDSYHNALYRILSVRVFLISLLEALYDNFGKSVHDTTVFRRELSEITIEDQKALRNYSSDFIFVDSHGSLKFFNKDTFRHSLCHSLNLDRLDSSETLIN